MKYHCNTILNILVLISLRIVLGIHRELPDHFTRAGHTNNWAVLVDTSRFWFNYRHVANVLSIYRSVKRLGIPDSQIILMVADDMACNPRNPRPATVFSNANQHINVYGDDVEVTVENFVRLLTGRSPPGTPRSKQLLTDEGSNVLVYLTGHGGDGFLKFQDSEEVTSQELADAVEQMWQKRRYHEIFFMIDTCQAASLYEKFYSPNILSVASSLVGEDSLSHHVDPAIGVYIIDRYTYYALDFLERVEPDSTKTMGEFLPDHFTRAGHTNNWAVLVDTSRFWFNYRHVANVLSIYRSVKRLGIPDSQIILMVADDMACNPRNPRPATVFNNANQHINVYGDDVEVDYRGYEVTVENFVRLLTGRSPPGTPRSKQLLTDEGSNVLVYLTGHGGDGFLKFQDSEEVTSQELADAVEQMWQKRRYHEIFFMIDTCQAASLYEKFYSPNILSVASSLVGEDSLSHHVDPAIGVYIIDRYTYYALDFLERVEPDSTKTMGEFLAVCPKRVCISTVGVRKDLFPRDPHKVLITDFFGSLRPVELTVSGLNVTAVSSSQRLHVQTEAAEKRLQYASQFPTFLFES